MQRSGAACPFPCAGRRRQSERMTAIAGRILGIGLLLTGAVSGQVVQELGGVVDLEAEAFGSNLPRTVGATAFSWETGSSVSGYSGSGYASALPNVGTNLNVSWGGVSPELRYSVQFASAGARYVWVRGYGSSLEDDSVHAGLDGSTSTASHITLTTTGAWQWTTNRLGVSGAPSVTASGGVQTFSLWMREDGVRVDRVLLVTNGLTFQPIMGNAWHIPNNPEGAAIPGMRLPFRGAQADEPVVFYTGNQFQGGGNAADQAQSSSRLFYRHVTNAAWSSVPLTFHSQAGNNKYYSGTLPAGLFNPGDTVRYYLRVGYTDRLPTYLFGNDSSSATTEFEAVAQQQAFAFTYEPAAEPAELAATYIWGSASDKIKAEVFHSGHVRVIGQSLDGTELGLTNTFLPPRVELGGSLYSFGRVLSSVSTLHHLEIRHALAGTSVVARLRRPADAVVRCEVIDWGGLTPTACVLGGVSPANEHFYGLGEKFNSFNQTGRRVRILTDDPPGAKGDKSYKVTPWFMSTRGYGFHLDSSAESWFDLRASFGDRYLVTNTIGTVAYNLVLGPRLTDVLSRYTAYTGRPALPPPWAFAPWLSSDIWRDGGEVRYVLTRYRQHGLPGSVLVFDSPWQTAYNDFRWNMTQFGAGGTYEGQFWPGFTSVSDMMTFLRTNGWKAVCWMTPFVNNNGTTGEVPGQMALASTYAEGAASNYFVRASPGGPPLVVSWWKGQGSPVDFTHPQARQWLQQQLAALVAESGGVVGGFKTDDGESGNPPYSYIPKTAVYYDGRTGVEMANAFATEYHKAIWEVLGTGGVLFARSGFTGSQAYTGYWAGDNEPNFGQDNGLQSAIVAGQSAAMSAYSVWGHDIGAYQNSNVSSTPTNLFMRWTQFGGLSPIMQIHRQVGANNQYPWSYGVEALDNYRFYAELHTALFPYLYSYAAESSSNGLPMIRPLVLLNQEDSNTFGVQHTYCLGNELLVAPVITNLATSRAVYLPAGAWYDFFTQHRHVGGQTILWTNTDLLRMPLFVREGGIVPMLPGLVETLCDEAYFSPGALAGRSDALEFRVYPGPQSRFAVYDGTVLTCETNDTVTRLDLTSEPRAVTLRVLAPEPHGVERDGVRLPRFASPADFEAVQLGWRHDGQFLLVRLAHRGGAAQIRFGPDSVGDGVSDSWRGTHFSASGITNETSCSTCDPDQDGVPNDEEYRAGTDPMNAASRLVIEEMPRTTGGYGLRFASTEGLTYRVEVLDGVLGPEWTPAPAGVSTGTGDRIQINTPWPAGSTQRYSRLRLGSL